MKQWQVITLAGVIALLAGMGGYQLQQNIGSEKPTTAIQKPISPEAVVGTMAEEFILPDMNGNQRHLSEWQGKIIAINFWATWCAPCREEIPDFVELQRQYNSAGLQFIGITLQQTEEIVDFIAAFNVNYPSLVGGNEVIKIAKKLGNGIGALPYTVIIDRSGRIVFTRRGRLSKSEAESVIQTLL